MFFKKDSLPEEYKGLFNIKNAIGVSKHSKNQFIKQSCFIEGMYVTVTIQDQAMIESLLLHNQNFPLVN